MNDLNNHRRRNGWMTVLVAVVSVALSGATSAGGTIWFLSSKITNAATKDDISSVVNMLALMSTRLAVLEAVGKADLTGAIGRLELKITELQTVGVENRRLILETVLKLDNVIGIQRERGPMINDLTRRMDAVEGMMRWTRRNAAPDDAPESPVR